MIHTRWTSCTSPSKINSGGRNLAPSRSNEYLGDSVSLFFSTRLGCPRNLGGVVVYFSLLYLFSSYVPFFCPWIGFFFCLIPSYLGFGDGRSFGLANAAPTGGWWGRSCFALQCYLRRPEKFPTTRLGIFPLAAGFNVGIKTKFCHDPRPTHDTLLDTTRCVCALQNLHNGIPITLCNLSYNIFHSASWMVNIPCSFRYDILQILKIPRKRILRRLLPNAPHILTTLARLIFRRLLLVPL
jgi:hypothetical protein